MIHPGRLILPALRWQEGTGFSHLADQIEASLRDGVGGFIIFGGTAEEVRTLTAGLTRRAGRPLLFAADLERGAGQQFDGLTEFPPPLALAALGDRRVIRWAAEVTAWEARSVGVQWILAPVADLDVEPRNPIVQTRAFGADPGGAAAAVAEWVRGCQAGGALSCAKHWPGHGRTTADSHDGVPVVIARARELGRELAPFDAAIEAGVSAVMTAHVSYPAFDSSGAPATFSALTLARLRDAGYGGPIVTDALMMEGARRAGGGDPAVDALAAGCDLLLYPPDPAASIEAIRRALDEGVLSNARVEEALGRYDALLAQAILPAPGAPIHGPFPGAAALADALLARLPSPVSRLSSPISLSVIDDDLGGRWPAGPTDGVARGLKAIGVPLGEGGSRIVLVFAEPRASKGRGGLGPASEEGVRSLGAGADAVIVFGHPRLAESVPEGVPVLVAWHRQRPMQGAVARWIAARAR